MILDWRFMGPIIMAGNFDLPSISWTWTDILGKPTILDLFNILDLHRFSCKILCMDLKLKEKEINQVNHMCSMSHERWRPSRKSRSSKEQGKSKESRSFSYFVYVYKTSWSTHTYTFTSSSSSLILSSLEQKHILTNISQHL